MDTNLFFPSSYILILWTAITKFWQFWMGQRLGHWLANWAHSHDGFQVVWLHAKYLETWLNAASRISLYFFCILLTVYPRWPSRACCTEASTQHDAATTRLHEGDGAFLVLRNVTLNLVWRQRGLFLCDYCIFRLLKKKNPNYSHYEVSFVKQ